MVIDGFLSVRRTGNGMPLLSSLPAAAEADRNARRLAEGLDYNDHGQLIHRSRTNFPKSLLPNERKRSAVQTAKY
jgi:hypothetical protein